MVLNIPLRGEETSSDSDSTSWIVLLLWKRGDSFLPGFIRTSARYGGTATSEGHPMLQKGSLMRLWPTSNFMLKTRSGSWLHHGAILSHGEACREGCRHPALSRETPISQKLPLFMALAWSMKYHYHHHRLHKFSSSFTFEKRLGITNLNQWGKRNKWHTN